MSRETAVEFAGARRIHIGLEVTDVSRAVAFYRVLFGEEPTKVRPGYAKFEPREPSVILSLSEGSRAAPTGVGHFGVQVKSSDDVEAMAQRFRAAGIRTRIESGAECCYAVSDKVWVDDPDGNPWEVYVVLEADAPRLAPADGGCCENPA